MKTMWKDFILNAIQTVGYHFRFRAVPGPCPVQLHTEVAIKDSYSQFQPHFNSSSLFSSEKELILHALKMAVENSKTDSLFIQFGVAGAKTLNLFARKYPNILFHGFDGFHGLEEDWTGASNAPAGAFSREGKPPRVKSNVNLEIGWVQDTLEGFLERHRADVAFVHFDMDTYTPTKFALERIRERLVPGSILLFDEFYGYPNWRNHEYKALVEVLDEQCYEYISFGRHRAAIRIIA